MAGGKHMPSVLLFASGHELTLPYLTRYLVAPENQGTRACLSLVCWDFPLFSRPRAAFSNKDGTWPRLLREPLSTSSVATLHLTEITDSEPRKLLQYQGIMQAERDILTLYFGIVVVGLVFSPQPRVIPENPWTVFLQGCGCKRSDPMPCLSRILIQPA